MPTLPVLARSSGTTGRTGDSCRSGNFERSRSILIAQVVLNSVLVSELFLREENISQRVSLPLDSGLLEEVVLMTRGDQRYALQQSALIFVVK